MARIMCNVCGIRAGKTGSKGSEISSHADMCNYCFEEGGYENQHSDHNHDAIRAEVDDKGGDPATYLGKHDLEELDFMSDCWICYPELNLAQQPASKQAGKPKAQGERRTQLNHKEMCTHAQTPKARRTCKNAFWAGVQVMVTTGKLTEDQAWEHCIKALSTDQAANATAQADEWVKVPGTKVEASTKTNKTRFTVAPKGHVGVGGKSLKAVKAGGK
jgi:hypothetical protein